TMGSFTRVNVHRLDLNTFLANANVPVYGADMDGMNLFEKGIKTPSIMVMGSESNGIGKGIQKHITQHISIPRSGNAESLNVGVATGIIASYLRMSR
ncbi:MAG: TrmH family RNA methyltransferase, partial [Bacteroidota bacterium]